MKKLAKQEQQRAAKVGKQKVANASKRKQKVTNVADSDSDTDSDSDSDTDSDVATATASDSRVDGLQEVIDFYENNIGMLSPYGLETLSDYAKEMPNNLIILAMKKAVDANVRTIQYIKGILNSWNKKGIKSILEAEKEDEQFRSKTKQKENKNYKNFEQREYENLDAFIANKPKK